MAKLDLLNKTGAGKSRKEKNYNEEFAPETFPETHGEGTMAANNSYYDKGVHVYNYGDRAKLVYDGILAKSGAQDIYAVIGFGSNDSWEDVRYYPMQKTDSHSFEVLIPEIDGRTMNIAFKDGADNWDNNSGANYTF